MTGVVRRAEEAGCAALVLTVDVPRLGSDAMHLAGCADITAARALRAGTLGHDTGVTAR